MKFNIEIRFGTGDSNGSHEESEILDFEFSSIETADENCKRIVDHYKAYRSIEDRHSTKKWDDFKKERWFSPPESDGSHYPEYSITLINDNGNGFKYGTGSYIGYFEWLEEVKIIQRLPAYQIN